MDVVSVVCCQVEVSAVGRSLAERIRTECGVSECDREATIIRMPWPTRGGCTVGGGGEIQMFARYPCWC